MRDRGQLLGVIEHHAYRLAGSLGEKIADRRFDDGSFAAEVAADGKNMNFDVGFVETEVARKAAAQSEGRFVRRPDLDRGRRR